jgi:hypothetical protein
MSWPPNLNLPTIGVIGFVLAPLFYFPGGGIFFRASKEAQVGSCDCGCGVMGGYAKYSTTIEFGVFLGIMTPNIHVSTPFEKTKVSGLNNFSVPNCGRSFVLRR